MAIGKSKPQYKKKGAKKKSDPYLRKEWYDLKAPVPYTRRVFGKTVVTKTTGTKIASDQLKGRVVETSLADLNDKSEQMAWRKVKLCIEEVQGKACLTNFHGMDMTRDKQCSYLRKWHTLIDIQAEIKTTDGYILRLFMVAFTNKVPGQIRKCSYAQHAQVKQIRKKIIETVNNLTKDSSLSDIVSKLTKDDLTEESKKACQFIYPLSNVIIKKVKTLKKPKFDVAKLNELYKEAPPHAAKTGDERKKGGKGKKEDEEPKNLLSA
jgi:small subunit ribosomal protein S3Ae